MSSNQRFTNIYNVKETLQQCNCASYEQLDLICQAHNIKLNSFDHNVLRDYLRRLHKVIH